MSFFPPAIGAVSVTQSDVRQTVNTGPVNSSGRADFLEAGAGLQVVTKDVDSSTPLNITFGDGFDSNGKRDVLTVVSSSLSWDDLPNNTDGISLFIRLSGASVTTFFQTLAPNYSLVRPSSPSEGQTWYPVDHRSRMEIYDDGDWDNENLIICVGECSTDGGAVVDVRSWAYQCASVINLGTQDISNVSFSFSHNIGAQNVRAAFFANVTSTVSGYTAGDRIELLGVGADAGADRSWAHVQDSPSASILAGESVHRVPRKSGGSNGTGFRLTSVPIELVGEFRRAF